MTIFLNRSTSTPNVRPLMRVLFLMCWRITPTTIQPTKIGENNLDEKRVDSKQARRALARWMSLHPTTVSQKVEFIIKHFKANIAHLLEGEAKAMVVTSGRPQAVKYKLAF
ncbi:hypothetical protein ABR759_04565 [Escherichia coli]